MKALLKRFYDPAAMPMLGGYEDPEAEHLVPVGVTGHDMLALAVETYRANAALNLSSQRVEDSEGQPYILVDPDMPG